MVKLADFWSNGPKIFRPSHTEQKTYSRPPEASSTGNLMVVQHNQVGDVVIFWEDYGIFTFFRNRCVLQTATNSKDTISKPWIKTVNRTRFFDKPMLGPFRCFITSFQFAQTKHLTKVYTLDMNHDFHFCAFHLFDANRVNDFCLSWLLSPSTSTFESHHQLGWNECRRIATGSEW